ncbi:hypothetical protein AURDEDRAFT_162618 [Auricularia subglabra TFB-10046 SS5]|nr:hypothetical protein AURDEDRAFT_162618 [Auricularia subglabra TFB-10046 SS5]
MAPITLCLRTKSQTVGALQQLRACTKIADRVGIIVIGGDTAVPKIDCIDEPLFTDILVVCRNVRRLDLDRWAFKTITVANIRRLAAIGSLSGIETLSIGQGPLSSRTLFSLLSLMPALKHLELLSVFDASHDSPIEQEPFPTPACRLRHLFLYDDWGIDFPHYAHLLCNSHDTLEHLELHWVSDPSIGECVTEAVSACRSVRDLVLIGNNFDSSSIIPLCPRIRRLMLIEPPTDEENAALRAPLRDLRLVHCTPASDSGVIADHLPRWRVLVPQLRTLRSMSVLSHSIQRDDSYHKLHRLCAQQRVRLDA